MNLNLNFDLYKGKTALKHWWGEVKNHFTQVQTAHNDLEDTVAAEKTRLDTETAQRTNKDVELNARIDGEVTARTNADSTLGSRITSETSDRINADDEIKESIESFKTEYLGGNSTAAFEWIGEPPEAELTSISSPEPSINIDLSGMFKLDGVPCGTMTETLILLNYIEENPDGNIEFNGGITYIVASFNPKTKNISVTYSDAFVESSVTNNIWTFTVARYYCSATPAESGGYVLTANGGTPYTGSTTVDKENLSDKIDKNSQMIMELNNPTFTAAVSRANISSGEKFSVIFGKIQKWFSDLKTVAFTGNYSDLNNKPTIPTNISQLTNDSGFKTTDTTYAEATASQSGLMSSSDKAKLNDIASGANNYTHPSSHAASMITQDSTHRFVTDTEKTAWNGKVDKVAGKGLSSNDFTDEYIEKIDSFAGTVEGGVVTGVKGSGESTYRGGNVNITKANIGLGNVDNTSDANKPISTAVQTALNGKASVNHTHTVDSALSSTSTNPVQNKVIKQALDSKANANHTHFMPQWDETGPAEWTTDVDLVCPNLSVSNGLYFNSNGYLSIDEVTEAINRIMLKLGING